jgi:chemotaxis protein MotB
MQSSYDRLILSKEPGEGWLDQNPYGGSDSGSWAVPWSDLMMTMFILFAVLFVFASAKRDFFGEIRDDLSGPSRQVRQEPDLPKPRVTRWQTVPRDSLGGMTFSGRTTWGAGQRVDAGESTRDWSRPDALPLDQPLLFDRLSAKLEPQALSLLQSMLPALQQSPLDVEVVGYTDGLPVHTPAFANNWALGTARAMSVANWLMHEGGIDPSRIIISSRGPNKPRVPNTSRANRIHNRRVEIFLTGNRQGK